ncbi:hypothetical protein mRhiFer1_008675 [Rhinolophus ferrumequinum]|uniref:Uncharacterized protein n=1 Tax=Rhinolophus ferrumequinum TaxID=59479 RepID=A0A7J7U164_RHIFE|nr:hypothetical protein mRhiFer1_008675 [Rhinolophus ferrumequinum]
MLCFPENKTGSYSSRPSIKVRQLLESACRQKLTSKEANIQRRPCWATPCDQGVKVVLEAERRPQTTARKALQRAPSQKKNPQFSSSEEPNAATSPTNLFPSREQVAFDAKALSLSLLSLTLTSSTEKAVLEVTHQDPQTCPGRPRPHSPARGGLGGWGAVKHRAGWVPRPQRWMEGRSLFSQAQGKAHLSL